MNPLASSFTTTHKSKFAVLYRCSVQTLLRLILSLLRLKSVSSQASPGSPACCTPVSPGGRAGGAGGAFSWSLRCSSCRTSSVFSRWRSPGTGVTMALQRENMTDAVISEAVYKRIMWRNIFSIYSGGFACFNKLCTVYIIYQII